MRKYWLAVVLMIAALPVMAKPVKSPTVFSGTKAYCYFNEKTLTWRIGNDVQERTVHFERATGSLRTVTIKAFHTSAAVSSDVEGVLLLNGDRKVTLDSDWSYSWQSVATPENLGRKLTIHMQGVNTHKGMEVEVIYETLPGNRPYLNKQIAFINRTGAPMKVEEVTIENLTLQIGTGNKALKPVTTAFSTILPVGSGLTFSPYNTGIGLLMQDKSGIVKSKGKQITSATKPAAELAGDGGRYLSPVSTSFLYTGGTADGGALINRYSGK